MVMGVVCDVGLFRNVRRIDEMILFLFVDKLLEWVDFCYLLIMLVSKWVYEIDKYWIDKWWVVYLDKVGEMVSLEGDKLFLLDYYDFNKFVGMVLEEIEVGLVMINFD